MDSVVKKWSVVLDGHKTSVSLENEFWSSLKDIAKRRNMTMAKLIMEIDSSRDGANLSSALRLHALNHYMELCHRR